MAKVLIADDAAFIRMKSATLVQLLGHDVLEAANGAEAVAMYEAHRPDAVLLDITMPVMDGIEALKRIIAADPGARVAMVTAIGRQQIIMDAIRAGAKDFVVKPFDSERIAAALAKLVG